MNTRISELNSLIQRYPELKDCCVEMETAFKMMCGCFRSGGKLLLCGNGGSAADAEHWAGELLKGFASRRSLTKAERDMLPTDVGIKLQGALPAIPLTGFSSFCTAFGNDVDPQLTFAQLVWGLGKPEDIIIGISTSGNAKNVCHAMMAAKARRMMRIGLSGMSGGMLYDMCDLCIRVPATETYRIQELHIPVYHCLSLMLEDEFFG